MDNKNSFVLYHDQREVFKMLSKEQAGELIQAIFDYEVTGEMPKLSEILSLVIIPIKQSIDRNRIKYNEIADKRKLSKDDINEDAFFKVALRINNSLAVSYSHFDFYILEKYKDIIHKEDAYKHVACIDYHDFLKTPYWKTISAYAKYKAGYKCSACYSQKKLETHHLSYENKGMELWDMDDLVVLCAECHQTAHDIDNCEETDNE